MRFLSSSFLVVFLAGAVYSQSQTNEAKKTAADYYVHSLPGQPAGPLAKMHAGHIEVDSQHNGNLFFWHIQNKHIADRERTVIWLNGGPGCSSMDGALMEVGPYRLQDEHTLVPNNGSWHEFANLLFVDNPVGTGFSYVDTDSYIHELQEMADQFIRFLENFFVVFPEYSKDDIYIAGESYAGQHIPYIAKAILDRNKQPSTTTRWNVKGLLIGNGWIDPLPQYQSYLPFAYEHGLVAKDSPIADKLETQQTLCEKIMAEKGSHVDLSECEEILQTILSGTRHNDNSGAMVCWNMYDIRLEDSFPSCGMNWPPDLTLITPYLRREGVKKALHVNPEKKAGWTECSGAVSRSFRAAHSKPAIELLPELLEHMPIILFSGDKDLICNHMGTEQLIHKMEWNGGKGFELSPGVWAPRHDWIFENEPAGIYQSARNLTYVLYYNASHMVPFDFPRKTRDMLDRFIGVNIDTIGGDPTENRIGGEKAPVTSVGGTPNSTLAEAQLKEKMDKARWEAYYHSGEVALAVVAVAASIWGVVICCARRRSRGDYRALNGGLKDRSTRLEEGSFDPQDLDDLTVATPMFSRRAVGEDEDRYSVGGTSSDEEAETYTDKSVSIKLKDGIGRGSRHEAGSSSSQA